MKVLDLRCENGHIFEAWFASENDFQRQLSQGYLTCPMCGGQNLTKQLSAPRLNLSKTKDTTSKTSVENKAVSSSSQHRPATTEISSAKLQQIQQQYMHFVQNILSKTEDVGTQFVEEARKMYYQESPERPIRGVATKDECAALYDEGIEVLSLPILPSMKSTLQ
jgi:hypothetical protein